MPGRYNMVSHGRDLDHLKSYTITQVDDTADKIQSNGSQHEFLR